MAEKTACPSCSKIAFHAYLFDEHDIGKITHTLGIDEAAFLPQGFSSDCKD